MKIIDFVKDAIKRTLSVYNTKVIQFVNDGLSGKQDTISDLSTIRSGAQKGATAYQKPVDGIPASDMASDVQRLLVDVEPLRADVSTIEATIPSTASEENKLADVNFVNSSISTATATFRGTFNSVAELEQVTADANDYAFVISTDSAGNTVYNRYKYSNGSWLFEYALNNSSFTAAQWAAINSAITSGEVDKLKALPTKEQLDTLFSKKVDKEEGKGLSTNDFTNEYKEKLESIGWTTEISTLNEEGEFIHEAIPFMVQLFKYPQSSFDFFANLIANSIIGKVYESIFIVKPTSDITITHSASVLPEMISSGFAKLVGNKWNYIHLTWGITEKPDENNPDTWKGYLDVEVSTDYVSMINNCIHKTQKGVAGGVASLGNDGKVPLEQLPTAEEQVQTDWNENDVTSKAHINNRTHYTETGEPVAYDSISWNRFDSVTLRFEEDGYGTDEGGTFTTLQPSVITSNMELGTKEKRFSKPIVFKLDDATNVASAIVDKAQIRLLIYSESKIVELYFYKIDHNAKKLYYRKTYTTLSSGIVSTYDKEVDIIDHFVNINDLSDTATLEVLDFTTEIVHKLDSKFLNLDEEVDEKSENPVKNKAVHAYVKGETLVVINSILELLNSGYYSKEQVDELLKAVSTGSFVAVETLPQPSEECLGKIYLIPNPDPETENLRDEYICILNPDYVEGESEAEDKYIWENIGSTKIDLSNYYTKSDVDDILKASQADWNSNEVDSLAHVKNRTHYEEKNTVIQSFVDEEVSVTLLERQSEQGGGQTLKVLLNIGDYSKDYTLKLPHDDYDSDPSKPPIKTDLKYNDDFIYIGGYIYDNNLDCRLGLILLNEGILKEVLTAVQLDPNDSAGASYSLGTLSADRIGDIIKKLDLKFLPDSIKIPDGGTAGQILSKKTDADQDVEWTTLQQEFLLLDFTQGVNVNAPAIASGSNPVNIDVYVPTAYQEKWKISSLPKFECKNGNTRVDVVFGSAFSMDGQKTLRLRTFACGTETKQITSIGGAMLLMKR